MFSNFSRISKKKSKKWQKLTGYQITVDIGGYKCSTSLLTLRAKPESILGTMFSGRHPIRKEKDGSVFIDRDGTHFRIILNYLRGGIASSEQLPDNKLLLSELLTEVNYYQLKGLEKIIKSEEKESMKVITKKEIFDFVEAAPQGCFVTTKALSFRNSKLIGLRLEDIIFKHSVDFSGSSLMKTTFTRCYFFPNVQYSFDPANLNCCKFESCFVEMIHGVPQYWHCIDGGNRVINMVKNKNMTFHEAQNIEFAIFDNETIRDVIKETYRCL